MLSPAPPHQLPAGLCLYGFTGQAGITWPDHSERTAPPRDAAWFLRLAGAAGLIHLELPAVMLPDEALPDLLQIASECGAGLLIAGQVLDPAATPQEIDLARRARSPLLRCILSRVLCGRRGDQPGGWEARLANVRSQLTALVPLLRDSGVQLALENHQDISSWELIELCSQAADSSIGITFDTGNPLATGEAILPFFERAGPFVRHIHLKDYRVIRYSQGYRLVRCALGAGVVPLREIIRMASELPQQISMSLEMAALEARSIPIFDKEWRAGFPQRAAGDWLDAIESIWMNAEDDSAPWRTPFERGSFSDLLMLEMEEFRASVHYLRSELFPERAGAAA